MTMRDAPRLPTPHTAREAGSPFDVLLASEHWLAVVHSLRLSGRESQIVERIITSATQDQIAIELGISPHTVHTYLERLYAKLGVSNRVQLVIRVFEEYLRVKA